MGGLLRPETLICGAFLAIVVGLLWFVRSTAVKVARILAHREEGAEQGRSPDH
jgi:hypothetical protein